MTDRYDLFFTGQLADGADPDTARANMARLFKTDIGQIARLFDGKPHLLKRDLDQAEAAKYRAVLLKAGIVVAAKAKAATSSPAPAVPAATGDVAPSSAAASDWSLAASGSELLRPEERPRVTPVEVDISHIKLTSPFTEPEPVDKPQPAPPPTDHLTIAAAGADLLTERPAPAPAPELDLSALSVAAPGADLQPLPDQRPTVNPPTDHLSLAEPGATLAEAGPQQNPAVPDISHLQLADDDRDSR